MKINSMGNWALLAAAAALTAGCRGDQDMLAMKIELNALKQELEYVRHQAEDLEPRLQATEQMALQAIDDRDAPAHLDCLRGSDEVLRTRFVALTVACEGAVAHGGGHRIRLRIGNPTSARLDRLSLTLYAGEHATQGRSTKRLLHETQMSLPPGASKSIEVEFDGVDAEDVRELAVRGIVGTVALAAR